MSSAARPGMQATLTDILAYQDELVRTGQIEFLGRMKVLVIEASDGAMVAENETNKLGVRFDWYNEPNPNGGYVDNFIPIAQSFDRRMLMCLAPIVRRHGPKKGSVGLPDIPDPNFKPENRPIGKDDKGNPMFDPNPVFQDPPFIEQSLVQRGVTLLRENQDILVAQPVHQIMFQPELNKSLLPTYWKVECGFDPSTRTNMAFLVDRRTGAAHFYGGKFEIVPVG